MLWSENFYGSETTTNKQGGIKAETVHISVKLS